MEDYYCAEMWKGGFGWLYWKVDDEGWEWRRG